MRTDEINIRDPFVLLDNGTYYLYGTRGETCWGPATGFDVYWSDDLENWEGPLPCFENDGSFWADRNYWAPEVHPWQGPGIGAQRSYAPILPRDLLSPGRTGR